MYESTPPQKDTKKTTVECWREGFVQRGVLPKSPIMRGEHT